jgi:flagellar hook-basal body complex protein FliE
MKIEGRETPLAGIGALAAPQSASPAASDPAASFGAMLQSALQEVGDLQAQADRAARDLASGRKVDIHQTMIGMEKADLSFQLLMQVRNKLVAAYEEINRMQM